MPPWDAQCLGGDADSPAVQGRHGHLKATVDLTQQVLLRRLALIRCQLGCGGALDAHLFLVLADGKALKPFSTIDAEMP